MTGIESCKGVMDFLSAARLFEQQTSPESILAWLCPVSLDEAQAHGRVHLLVAVGAVLTGQVAVERFQHKSAPGPLRSGRPTGGSGTDVAYVRALTWRFLYAGSRLDIARIQDLIAVHCTQGAGVDEVLADVAVELLDRFAAIARVSR